MSKHRTRLPQLDGGLFLTDGGIETTLIFHDKLDLPHFAAFHLLRDEKGRRALKAYYERYLAIAEADGAGFILESPTWRASADWGHRLGLDAAALRRANVDAMALMCELRAEWRDRIDGPIVVSGAIGPRGDGYGPGRVMTEAQAEAYHG